MPDFVTLSCPSCGARLEITPDVDRFACGHCGQAHLVKRAGGIVSLAPVVDALNKVGVGVDKTASELAIVRVKKEIEEIRVQRATLLRGSPRPTRSAISFLMLYFGGAIGVLSLAMAFSSESNQGLVPCGMIGAAVAILGAVQLFILKPNTKHWDETTGVQIKSLDDAIAAKSQELQRLATVVSTR